MEENVKQKKDELLKIAAEIIIGVAVAILLGIFIDYFINTFLPQYKIYEGYVNESVHAIIVLIVGFMVAGSLIKYIEYKISTSRKELYGISLIIRIVIYIIILAIVLSVFHISITGILAGSAIGGVVLGFAVQTVASSLLSGLFVTSTGTLKYGDIVNINSWVWSIDTVGKIIDIKTLFSKMLTKDNTIISIPNSALLGSGVMVEYKREDSKYVYPVDITINSDVPYEKVIENVKNMGKDVDIYLSTKAGTTNVLLAYIKFDDVLEINDKTSELNAIIDKSYWDVKAKMLLIGNNTLYEYNQTDGLYPFTITLNSDIAADKIIENVQKIDNNIKVRLISKTGGTNVFSSIFKYGTTEENLDNINRINLLFESVYNEMKNSKAK